MENKQNDDASKQILELLKKDYNKAAKIWAWGKAINEWKWAVGLGVAFVFFIILIGTAIVSAPKPTREQEIAYGGLIKEFAQGFEQASDFMEWIYKSLNGRKEYEQELLLVKIIPGDSFEEIEKKYKEAKDLANDCPQSLNMHKEYFITYKNPFYQGSRLVQVAQKINSHAFSGKKCYPKEQEELEAWAELCQRCQKKYVEIEQIYLQALKDQRASLEKGDLPPPQESTSQKSDFFEERK